MINDLYNLIKGLNFHPKFKKLRYLIRLNERRIQINSTIKHDFKICVAFWDIKAICYRISLLRFC